MYIRPCVVGGVVKESLITSSESFEFLGFVTLDEQSSNQKSRRSSIIPVGKHWAKKTFCTCCTCSIAGKGGNSCPCLQTTIADPAISDTLIQIYGRKSLKFPTH